MSNYPTSLDSFVAKADGPGHYVYADYFNDLQAAVAAIQATLGVDPQGAHGTVEEWLTALQASGGTVGATGPTGPTGASGPAGAVGATGPAAGGLAWAGAWSAATAYAASDVVTHEATLYVAASASTGSEPGNTDDLAVSYGGTAPTVWSGGSPTSVAQRFMVSRAVPALTVVVKSGTAWAGFGTITLAICTSPDGTGVLATQSQSTTTETLTFSLGLSLAANTVYYLVATGTALTRIGMTENGVHAGTAALTPTGGEQRYLDGATTSNDYCLWFALHEDLSTPPWELLLSSSPSEATATYVTGSLGSSAYETGTVTMSRGYRISGLTTSRPARVRLYATAAARDADAARPVGTPIDSTTSHGMYLEFTTTTAVLNWVLPTMVDGSNREVSRSGVIPIVVDNRDSTAGTVTVELTYLPTEV